MAATTTKTLNGKALKSFIGGSSPALQPLPPPSPLHHDQQVKPQVKQEPLDEYSSEEQQSRGGSGGGQRHAFCSNIIQNLIDGAGHNVTSSSGSSSNSPPDLDMDERQQQAPQQHHHHSQHQMYPPSQPHHHQLQQQQQPNNAYFGFGPRLLERAMALEEEFKLEYMGLEDFLTENDMVIGDGGEYDLKQQSRVYQPSQQHHQQQRPQLRFTAPSVERDSPHGDQHHPQQSPHIPVQMVPPQSTATPPNDIDDEENHLQRPQQVYGFDQAEERKTALLSPPAQQTSGENIKSEVGASSESVVTAASTPGTNAPSMRKRAKRMVSDECKDAKYWERRRKNNLAAKRSRDLRRIKETQIA